MLDSIEGAEAISPETFDSLEQAWFESTDATGASLNFITARFHHLHEGDRVTIFLDQSIAAN